MAQLPENVSFMQQWLARQNDDSPEAVQWKEETIGNILDHFGAQLPDPNVPLADVHAIFVLLGVENALGGGLPLDDINLETMQPVFGQLPAQNMLEDDNTPAG